MQGGGGILNRGTLTLAGVVVRGNTSEVSPAAGTGNGGGIFNASDAALTLAELHWKNDRRDEALALLEPAQRKATRLKHHVRIAELRLQTGQAEAERGRLRKVLDDFHHAPWHVRKGQHAWAKRGRRLVRDGVSTR